LLRGKNRKSKTETRKLEIRVAKKKKAANLQSVKQGADSVLCHLGPEDLLWGHLNGEDVKAFAEVQVPVLVEVAFLGQHPTEQHSQGALRPICALNGPQLQVSVDGLGFDRRKH
jgi:hypothetical protein